MAQTFHCDFLVNTHVHADHVTGSGRLKTLIPSCKSAISRVSNAKADVHLDDGQTIEIGDKNDPLKIQCHSTPGHTDGLSSVCFSLHFDEHNFSNNN